jgi:dipeptidyl aminopeptidase/acylaminoacyl peptidase
MRIVRALTLLLFGVLSSKLIAQNIKRQLTEADYKLWSTMNIEQLSDAGKWVSYSLHYESGNDTLFVKNTKTLTTFAIPKGINGRFAKEGFFICQNSDGQLLLRNLTSGSSEVTKDVISYSISRKGNYVIIHRSGANGSELVIKNIGTTHEIIIPSVDSYSYNAVANSVVYNSGPRLLLTDLDANLTKTITTCSATCTFSDFVWQKNGEAVAYFVRESIVSLGYYSIKEQSNYLLGKDSSADFPKGSSIYNSSFTPLTISDNGTKVFFGLKPTEDNDEYLGVQLWNTADKSLYQEKRKLKGWTVLPKVAVWIIADNTFKMVTSIEYPYLTLTGDQKNALLFNPIANDPQFDRDAPIDFYLLNIATGEQKLFLSKQSADLTKLSVSSTGRFVAYFKDNDWWVYDIDTNEHQNLTVLSGKTFNDETYNRSGEKKVAGIAGWTINDAALLIYDTYDVWLFKTDGSGYKKLTDGREKNLIYRVVPQSLENQGISNFSWNQKGSFNLAAGLVLKATNDATSGYFRWEQNIGMHKIIFGSNRLSEIKISSNDDVTVYTEEHYHLPPRIIVRHKDQRAKILYASNAQQKKYNWGFSKLISFVNFKGETLKGALFYPAGYTPDKSYPMVVHIYERQAAQYSKYTNPTVFNYDGFNISNFTSQGYFVLLPDINKIEGNPGRSAVDCVSAAVAEVLAHEPINPNKIGLVGHSFGGYQTNFIITQTNIFAAAISGSGISDVVSDYLYVSGNTSKANGWRYEFNQASIGVSPFDNYDAYIRNSPITYAKHIKTPLLLWSGDQDITVNYSQSVELYLSLRRMQKASIMLLYEGDSHSIGNKLHQRDLTIRMQEWFNYYLQAGEKPNWLQANKL